MDTHKMLQQAEVVDSRPECAPQAEAANAGASLAGPSSIAASAATKPPEAARLRPSGNDLSRKQVKTSKANKRPRPTCVCSPASSRREARPTSQPGADQPCAKRRPAWRRLRPAHAGKAAPRPSQAPSGPRPPQPGLARSQASGVGPLPAGWSEGLTTGRCRGTDTSPRRLLSEVLCCAQHSARKQELGGSPKNRAGRVPVAYSNFSRTITFISAIISKKYCNYLL